MAATVVRASSNSGINVVKPKSSNISLTSSISTINVFISSMTSFISKLTLFFVSSNFVCCISICCFCSAVHGEVALINATSVWLKTSKYIFAVLICSSVAYAGTCDFSSASSTAKQFCGTDGVVACRFILLAGVVEESSASNKAMLFSAAFIVSTVCCKLLRLSFNCFCSLSRLLAVMDGSSVVKINWVVDPPVLMSDVPDMDDSITDCPVVPDTDDSDNPLVDCEVCVTGAWQRTS